MRPKSLRLAAALLLGGFAASALADTSAPPRPVVRIDTGALQGVAGRDPAITVYRGIPYAAAPIGPLRFRPPTAAKPWQGVRAADRFGAMCPQLAPATAQQPMDEDCLTANVWTAATRPGERRPVFVWIYGGGFNEGSGSNPQFDGEGLARKGLVVVTFNYRVGPLGFLATPELSRESRHGSSGNYGLLDDIALLQWVKRNIAAFGGDPAQVTIAGQSAGAGSVQFLTLSPLAKGLFRRAIGESQVRFPGDPELRYLNTSWRSKQDAEAAGARFATDRGAKNPAELRALPWRQLLQGSNVGDETVQTLNRSRPPLFRPVVDGWIVPRTYDQAFAAGSMNPVTYVAGNNRDESGAVPETAFATLRASPPRLRPGMPTTNVTLSDYQTWARAKFGPMADDFLRLYPATNDDEAALANNAAARDNSRVSTWLWGRAWSRWVKLPMFTYFWTHALPGPTKPMRGAFHGSEINYVFNNLDATELPWTDEDHRIADVMSTYWANIAKTGNPNGAGVPEWPAFDPAKAEVMVVGDSFGPQAVASAEKRAFWERFFRAQEQW